MNLRINETLQTGAVRQPPLPFSRLVGTVSNCAHAVRVETAPTGGESVYLFLEFTIVPPLPSAYPPKHLVYRADFGGGRRGGRLP